VTGAAGSRGLAAVLAAGLAAGCGPVRLATAPGAFAPPAPRADLTSAEATKLAADFDAGADELYRLGNGDEVSIDVWDRPEVSGRHTVGPDGLITLPIVGSVPVADASREDAAARVRKALTSYLRDPIVTVRVERYTAQRVFVLGRVTNPGPLAFDQTPTLLEAVARAGGLPVGGTGTDKPALARCAVFRGRDRILWIDLKSVLDGTNLALNIRLKRNDTVYIPDSGDQLVYGLGELQRPGAFPMTAKMTLLDLIAHAGGLTEDAGAAHLMLVRPGTGERRIFSLAELLDPTMHLNVALVEGDILYASRSGMAKFGYVLSRISPVTGMILLGSTLQK
jgi:polysaccharide export outer membrane protein